MTSEYLAEGYWHRIQRTPLPFEADLDRPEQCCYRTGDLGRFLADGRFVFLGRRDHQVKIRGFRVDMREIESALLGMHDVAEVAVIATTDDDLVQLVAYVVLPAGFVVELAVFRERLHAAARVEGTRSHSSDPIVAHYLDGQGRSSAPAQDSA